MAQYDEIRKGYAELASAEPSKQYVQYPEILRLLGDVKNKKILDVGCGPGLLTRQIAQRGAIVTAYDNSVEQINLALEEENQNSLGIKYFVAETNNIEEILKKETGGDEPYFDSAVSTLVLHYAENIFQLDQFFSSTYNLLKNGSSFIAIVCNPDYKNLEVSAYNRIFHRVAGKVLVDFLDHNGAIKFSVVFPDFSREDYEKSAERAGFKNFKWLGLKITPEGIEKMGREFWKGFEHDCPYIGFTTHKD